MPIGDAHPLHQLYAGQTVPKFTNTRQLWLLYDNS